MKKKKRKKTIQEKKNQIFNILDKRYFHTCVSVKNKDEIEWEVYYCNLPGQTYFSKKNKPILSSKKNTIKDIYKLKDKLEKEKEKVLQNNLLEYSRISYLIYQMAIDLKRQAENTITNILAMIAGVCTANILFMQDIYVGLICVILCILITIYEVIKGKKINKEIDKHQKRFKEDFIEVKIRREGIFFIKRLKDDV